MRRKVAKVMESNAILKLTGVLPKSLAQLHTIVKDAKTVSDGKKYVSILKSSLDEGYETYTVTLGINFRILLERGRGRSEKENNFFSYLPSAMFHSVLRTIDPNILCEGENFVVPANEKTAENIIKRESEEKFEYLCDTLYKLIFEIFGDKSTKTDCNIYYVSAIGTQLASSLGSEIQLIPTQLSKHSLENDFSGFAYRGKSEKISLLVKKIEMLCKDYLVWYEKRKEEIMALVPEG